MILQLARIDAELGLKGGTARQVYERLVEKELVESKKFQRPTISDEQVKQYRNVFSKRSTQKSGLMSDSTRVRSLLEWFMLLYPDNTISDIISAAEKYVADRLSSDRPDLIMRADNFIKKGQEDGSYSSRLLEYLEDSGSSDSTKNYEVWI